MEDWTRSAILIAGTVALVVVNGFFVAAEFALVKIRVTRLVEMRREGHLRPPRLVPETMPIPRLLGHFQATRQHMAFVLDEFGSVIGIVTLENVLERIVGPVEDEFDLETPDVVPDGPRRFLVQGGTPLEVVNRKTGLALSSSEVDTLGGLVMEHLGRIAATGDVVPFEGAEAEVVESRGARATRIRITKADAATAGGPAAGRAS